MNAAGLLAGLGLAFFIAEVLTRVMAPQYYLTTPPGTMLEVGDPLTRLRPGFRGRLTRIGDYDTFVLINSLGIRGPEMSVTKEPGVYRILFLGDSFTFGFGVDREDSLPFLLEEEMRGGRFRVEALNAGIPGTGINNSLWWLEKYGLNLHPDLVILGVCLANDMMDADLLVYHFPVKWKTPHWLYGNSHAFRLLARRVSPAIRSRLGLTDSLLGTYDQTVGQIYLREMIARYKEGSPVTELAMQKNRTALDQLTALRGEYGVRLAAFLIPASFHLLDEPWQALLQAAGLNPEGYRRDLPLDFFRTELTMRAVPTLDLSDVTFEAMERGEPLFLKDGHWSPFGNRVTAKELHRFIREKGFLEKTDNTNSMRGEQGGGD